MTQPSLRSLEHHDAFIERHIGPNDAEVAAMLRVVGHDSLEALTDAIVPASIKSTAPLALPGSMTEVEALAKIRAVASKNQVFRSFIGQGYYGTHTPGGAVALLTVLSAEQLLPMGWYLLVPMAALSAVLVAVGVLYHRACGRPYLHQPHQVAKAQRPATRLALSEQDLEQLLQRFDQSNNLSPEDLGVMLAAAEEDAIKRRMSAVSCGEVMSAKLVTVSPQTPLEEIAELFHRHLVKCLPVVDAQGELIGRVLRADLFDWLWQGHRARQQQNLWQRLRSKPAKEQSVAQDLMRAPEMSVQEATPLGDLLQELASHTVQFIAVLRGKTLVGVITRSDVIRTLLSLNH